MVTSVNDVQHDEQPELGPILPVVIPDDPRHADALGDALVEGGVTAVEVTLRTPTALDTIAALAARGDLLVGAGTVLRAEQAEEAVGRGARFVVSPGFAPAVVRFCRDADVPAVPGVATATEIQTALDAGLDTVKFFPARQLGGPAMVQALAAPFRDVRFVPTGGVTPDVIADYLALPSVSTVGATWVVAPELIAGRRWDEIVGRVRTALAAAGRAS
ncbi:bifunctional 4-hydroxy-2-oxoglutarate aldolase/2-dehydro-3-deoxy-phosphogluconate aldolase [Micromonospora maritima]|uniref:bifunctional 4-hydroxy-2-oxoglutarate aldolase/2-dehydro-3-deoxy-phosphogluconate aldolase n=1 Tax=Micromonospora maritima TaxID=986711 RepID=UPI00157C10D7|nr:bifunctional 4-hydroxy-2-oxoglutarate aldolase/2-dehydro-3-deoxy-phosphogluconate aldolase [Micromonospora maritima]